MKTSEIRWAPELRQNWPIERTRYLFNRLFRAPESGDQIVTAFRDGMVTLRSNRREDGFTFALKEHGYQGVRAGDLVIHGMDAFAGAIGVSDSDGKCSPVYTILSPREQLDTRYYAYLFRHMAVSGYIQSLARGVRERSTEFKYDTIRDIHLPVPPYSYQKIIADFLDERTESIDGLIARKERLLELLQEKRRALITQAVTKGLDPTVPIKDSGIDWLGSIPAHWEITNVRKLVTRIEQGWSPQCESRPADPDEWGVTKVGCVNGGWFRETENKALPTEAKPRSEYEICAGDLLMSRANTRTLLGSTALVRDVRPRLLLSDKLYRIRYKSNVVLPEYLEYALSSNPVRFQLERSATGASDSMQNISQNAVHRVILAVAPLTEQRTIIDRTRDQIERVLKLEDSIRAQTKTLREYRQALITAAVTGQLDVAERIAEEGVA